MRNILAEIAEQTAIDVKKRSRELSLRELESLKHYESKRLDFRKALQKENSVSIIAEIKRASPSKGEIRADFKPVEIASSYMDGGASAVSVLTDEPFFKGNLKYLEMVAEFKSVPLLRKDFILEPYQVKEARAYGADAVLLISTMYSGNQLSELIAASKEFELQPLVECYHREEVEQLDWNETDMLGINNRDLTTFEVDLHRGVDLLNLSPSHVVRISESGIQTAGDIEFLFSNNIDAALIGEYLMRQPDPGQALQNLISESEKRIHSIQE